MGTERGGFAFVAHCDAFEAGSFAECEHVAKFNLSRSKVVEELCFEALCHLVACLQLENDSLLNHKSA